MCDLSKAFLLHTSKFVSTPRAGVHVHVFNGVEPFTTLCGMQFDGDGRCINAGPESENEEATPLDDLPACGVTCVDCSNIIDDLATLPRTGPAGAGRV